MTGKKYRLSLKAIAGECSGIFFAIPSIGIAVCLGVSAFATMSTDRLGSASFVLPIFFGLPAVMFIVFSLILILTPIGRVVFSYLSISDEGLEYRLWPIHRIRCTWNDVDQIKKCL